MENGIPKRIRITLLLLTLSALIALILAITTSTSQAATPEQVQAVIATMEDHPVFPGVRRRELTVGFLKEYQQEVRIVFGIPSASDMPKSSGATMFGIVIPTESIDCSYTLIDVGSTGSVTKDQSEKACADGRREDAAEFFDEYGGAQALYDKIVAEALK